MAAVGTAFEDSFEIAEEFGHAIDDEVGRASFRFRQLFLIVEHVCNRMMRLPRFIQPVGNRQLQLVGPQPA